MKTAKHLKLVTPDDAPVSRYPVKHRMRIPGHPEWPVRMLEHERDK